MMLGLSSTSERGLVFLIYFWKLAETQFPINFYKESVFILFTVCPLHCSLHLNFLSLLLFLCCSAVFGGMAAPTVHCHWTVSIWFWCWYIGMPGDIWVPVLCSSEYDEIVNDILHISWKLISFPTLNISNVHHNDHFSVNHNKKFFILCLFHIVVFTNSSFIALGSMHSGHILQ